MEESRSKTRAMCYPGGSDFIFNAIKRARKVGGAMEHGFGRSRAVVILNSIVLKEKGEWVPEEIRQSCHSFQDYSGIEYEM